MNIFQRLETLKHWFDNNKSLFQSNLTRAKEEFDRLYKTELNRFSNRSRQLRCEKEKSLKELQTISYDDWIEQQFQKLLCNLTNTLLDSDKNELIHNFNSWIKTTSRLDYTFRISSCEKEIADKIIENINRHDRQISLLQDIYLTWKTTEEDNFDQWMTTHPYYHEMNELEYLYDTIADDDISSHNLHYSYNSKTKLPKKKTIPVNWHRLQKIFETEI